MNSIKRTIHVPIVAIALLAGAIVGYQALGKRAIVPKPTVIAAVRIEMLFDGLSQRAEAKAEVDAMAEELEAEQASREARIKQMEQELEDIADPARREEVLDAIALETLRLQFWFQEARTEHEVEKALQLQYLYRTIKKAVGELAEAEGYDLVILDDSIDEPQFDKDSRIPAQMQVLQQIVSRKILYLSPTIDITDDLITRMNNEFRAAQAGR